jgi:serine/threonine protein kinase
MTERDIFIAALQIEAPAERQAYLDEVCGQQPELRARVGDLLRLYEGAGSFLQNPAVGTTASGTGYSAAQRSSLAEVPGAMIGPYTLLRQIGEGGMGAVWMAEQEEPVRRTVALKIIKAGIDSRQVIARFDVERQALALMDHPNIARVLDAGMTAYGRPFFVMELVKGTPITRYCDDRKLTPRQRLELFVPVCNAIQHAHQKGVIHRDIKPSNVLVAMYDERPVPKVIDFGVAKAAGPALTDATLMTDFGVVVGTPEYMSPEQASLNNLDIDTRSDVYSLGALLYELLTGTTPVDRRSLGKAAVLEILRIVREVEAPRPSAKLSTIDTLPSVAANRGTEPAKLGRLLKGELDWVVLKALEKDRSRRYESANGLARDIQRYLANEVVEARPPSTGYRLRKFVRRHKGQVIAAGLVLFALVAGIAGTTWQAWRATVAERLAKENERQALIQNEKAQENFRLAKESVDKYLNAVTDNPKLNEKDFIQLRKDLLETAVPFYQKFAQERNDDPEAEADRGRAYHRLGLVRDTLGEKTAALTDYESMRAIFAKLAAEYPSIPAYRVELAKCSDDRGNSLAALGKRGEAETAFRDGLGIKVQLANEFPQNPVYRWECGGTYTNLGLLLKDLGRIDEAEAAFRTALSIQVPLTPEFGRDPRHRSDLAASHNNLGILLKSQRRYAEAEAPHRAAQQLWRQLAAEFPKVASYRHDLAMSLSNFANLQLMMKKHGDAEAAYRDALSIQLQLVADFPSVPAYRQDLAMIRTNFAVELRELGKREEAEASIRAAIDILEKSLAESPGDDRQILQLGVSYKVLAELVKDKGQTNESLELFAKAVDTLNSLLKKEPRLATARQHLVNAHWARADAMDSLRRYTDAVRDWDRAIELSDAPQKASFENRRAQSLKLGAQGQNPPK